MNLKQLNESFVYKSEDIEDWKVPTLSSDGNYYNDCDGYALLVYFNVSELKNKQVYICKYKGSGHAICKVGDCFVDNIQQKLFTEDWALANGYTDIEPVSKFSLYRRMISSYLGIYTLAHLVKMLIS